MGGHMAPPLRCGADLRPGGCGVAPAGCLIQPALSRAHHAQVFRMLTVIHPPAIVFAFLQWLFRSVAANVVHPYGTWWEEGICESWGFQVEHTVNSFINHETLNWADWAFTGILIEGCTLLPCWAVDAQYFKRVWYCRSWNPFNLLFNLDLKAAVKNLCKPQQVLHKAAK